MLNTHENWFHPTFLDNMGNIKEIIAYKGIWSLQSTGSHLTQTEQVLWNICFILPFFTLDCVDHFTKFEHSWELLG